MDALPARLFWAVCAVFAAAVLGCQSEPADSGADATAGSVASVPDAAAASVPGTAAVAAAPSSVALEDLPVSQIVRFRTGPMFAVLEARGSGTLHIDPDCIVLEVSWGADESPQRYTAMFGEDQHVALASPTGPLVLHYPIFDRDLIRERGLLDRAERDRFAHVSTVHDGERVTFAAPNRWLYEHMNPDTGELVTRPHPDCPQEFWYPGTLRPVDVERLRDLPVVPRP
ncbi:hypothetical protein [Candidatus Poriferisodalis sp.]|uniref:hypothetical protein n=1 Tax=Candidatus Poriferisodalis sp. TaxID=3101277 RepID=UPI003B01925A